MSSPPAATTLPPVASEGPSSLVTDVDLELRHPWRTGQAANKEHAFLCQINRNEEQGRPVGRGGRCQNERWEGQGMGMLVQPRSSVILMKQMILFLSSDLGEGKKTEPQVFLRP